MRLRLSGSFDRHRISRIIVYFKSHDQDEGFNEGFGTDIEPPSLSPPPQALEAPEPDMLSRLALDPSYARSIPGNDDDSFPGLLLGWVLNRSLPLNMYKALYRASLSHPNLNLYSPYEVIRMRQRLKNVQEVMTFKEGGYSFLPLGALIRSLLEDKHVFSTLVVSTPFLELPKCPSIEMVAYDGFIRSISPFISKLSCSRGLFRLPPSYTFTDIEDFVVKHKWFNVPPLIFVNVIFFLDGVATLRLGGTALSLKCTLANISFEYRGRNSCWREMALLPEVKGATNRMVRLIESQLALLRKGILIPTNAGDAIIVGNIQVILGDHPERCRLIDVSKTCCPWCHIRGIPLLFAGMGRLRHLNTRGIFARESSKHFKPLHVIAADPLH
ncbi:hypothetical protein ADUPG1_000247, partial [Aduncisulcus paluster]